MGPQNKKFESPALGRLQAALGRSLVRNAFQGRNSADWSNAIVASQKTGRGCSDCHAAETLQPTGSVNRCSEQSADDDDDDDLLLEALEMAESQSDGYCAAPRFYLENKGWYFPHFRQVFSSLIFNISLTIFFCQCEVCRASVSSLSMSC